MELIDFLHVGTISHKLKDDWKFLGWAWSEMGVPVWWWDSKIDCIWRMNRWNIWTDFLLVDTWSQKLKADQIFYVIALWKMSVASLVTGRKDEQMESSHFFMLVQIQES